MFDTYREVADALRQAGISSANPMAVPLEVARAQQDEYFRYLNGAVPSVARMIDISIAGPYGEIGLRLSRPNPESAPLPCIVFLRGAGWWCGGLETHTRTINTLALLSGFMVCAVDYRRAPEHRFPVQCEEILTALRWIRIAGANHGILADRLVFVGESAGATLCLSVCQMMRNVYERQPNGLILFYPNASGPGYLPYSRWVWQNYLGTADISSIPGAIPILEKMDGLPPTWIGCGEDDRLLGDTYELAEKLRGSGVACELRLYEGMPHAFVMYSAILKPAASALADAAAAAVDFIKGYN